MSDIMVFRLEKRFNKIEKEWYKLYRMSKDTSPFMHPETFKISLKYFYPYYLRYKCRPLFGVFSMNNAIMAIIPILKNWKGDCQLFGFPNGFNESDIIRHPDADVREILISLSQSLPNMCFLKIDERNPVFQTASSISKIGNRVSNAAIYFWGNNYEIYFKSLSTSVRQNIRTAYNRTRKGEFDVRIEAYRGGDKSFPLDKIIDLYCKRHFDRYGVKTSPLKKWFLKHQSFATRIYRYSSNAITFGLYFNDELVAFMSGVYNDSRIIVPRLSINSEFSRYSPGLILVCETIKYMIDNMSIRIMDLSQGKEKYKYQLGAKEHFSYSFVI